MHTFGKTALHRLIKVLLFQVHAADWGDGKHGRIRTVRSRGRHFYRPGQRNDPRLRANRYYKVQLL